MCTMRNEWEEKGRGKPVYVKEKKKRSSGLGNWGNACRHGAGVFGYDYENSCMYKFNSIMNHGEIGMS